MAAAAPSGLAYGDKAPSDMKSWGANKARVELPCVQTRHIWHLHIVTEARGTKQKDHADYIQPDHFAKEPNKHKQTLVS